MEDKVTLRSVFLVAVGFASLASGLLGTFSYYSFSFYLCFPVDVLWSEMVNLIELIVHLKKERYRYISLAIYKNG